VILKRRRLELFAASLYFSCFYANFFNSRRFFSYKITIDKLPPLVYTFTVVILD